MCDQSHKVAQQGHDAKDHSECPHLFSSDMWLLWQLGAYLKRMGKQVPALVKKSRGFSVKAGEEVFKWTGEINEAGPLFYRQA